MFEITPEYQATARAKLVAWAYTFHSYGFSPTMWKTDKEVLEFVYNAELDVELLTHIAHWVWDPIQR